MANNGLHHRNSGLLIKNNGESVNMADLKEKEITVRNISSGSTIGKLSVSTSPVGIKVGSESLENRHTVQVINDSSFLIFVGFDSNMTIDEAVLVQSGLNLELRVDPSEEIKFYAMTEQATAEITVVEIK